MLMQKDLVNKLKDFGLNSYESKLWTALLSRGAATAGELSDIANVPRSRTYDVLESLEKKGFLIIKIGKPIKYLAVDPEHVLDRVRNKILEDAEVQTQIVSKLEGSEILNELKLLHKTGIKKINPEDFSGVFKGRKNIYYNLDKKIKNAKKQVFIQSTESCLITEHDFMRNTLRKAKERGIKIMIAAPVTEMNLQVAQALSAYGEVRNAPTNGRFYVIDDEEIVFMLTDEGAVHHSYDSAIWVKSPFFVSALRRMFMTAWGVMEKVSA